MGRKESFRRRGSVCSATRTVHIEGLEQRQLLAGLTIITHGFQLWGGDVKWMDEMADAVGTRIASETGQSTSAVSRVALTLDGTVAPDGNTLAGGYVSSVEMSSDPDPLAECVMTLNWSAVAGSTPALQLNTQTVAEWFTDYLLSTPSLTRWLSLPVHLIGHSRGGPVVSELSRLLGEHGIIVDQETYLDPHPWREGTAPDPADTVPEVYDNVVFADDYYRQDTGELFPDGYRVSGAANNPQTRDDAARFETLLESGGGYHGPTSGGDHANVHLWYNATIPKIWDVSTKVDDQVIGSGWFPGTMRSTTGYYYSRVVGGDRPDDGMLPSMGGPANNRVAVNSDGSSQWCNIGLNRSTLSSVTDGIVVSLPFYYSDPDSETTILFGEDSDQNPFNGGMVAHGSLKCARTNTVSPVTGDYDLKLTATDDERKVYVYAQISDGTHVRYYYLNDKVTVTPRQPNDPTVYVASPASGASTSQSSPTFHGTAIADPTRTITSVKWENLTTGDSGNANIVLDGNTATWSKNISVQDGSNSLRFTAYDSARRSASVVWSIVHQDLPTVTINASLVRWISSFHVKKSNPGDAFVGYDPAYGGIERTVATFALDSIPAGATIYSATLCGTTSTDGWGPGMGVSAYRLLEPWSVEPTWKDIYTYDGLGHTTSDGATVASVTTARNQVYSWDITKIAKTWWSDPSTNHGVVMMSTQEDIASERFFKTAIRLEVTYEPEAVAPTISLTIPTPGETLSTHSSPLRIEGSASDNYRVSSVQWKNLTSGLTGTASGTNTWAADVPLVAGENDISAWAIDASGNPSDPVTAHACYDTTPPTDVASFAAVAGDGQVLLTWSNPGDSDFAGVMIRRTTGGYPSSATDGILVYNGPGTSTTDTGLTNGTGYYYKAFAYDKEYNYSNGCSTSATPAPASPVSVSVSPSSVSEAGTTNLVYTFTRSGSTASALTINFTVTGTASYSGDYTQTGAASFSGNSGTVTIPAGQATANVSIDPVDDSLPEADESVILTVTKCTGYVAGSPSAATGTIKDDDTLVVSPTNLTVLEGEDADFAVRLAVMPTSNVTVAIARPSGDTDLTAAPASLTFTPDNWNVPQPVTVTAAQDADTTNGTATFVVSANGLASVSVSVTETDTTGTALSVVGQAWTDSYPGNNNGLIEGYEQVRLKVKLNSTTAIQYLDSVLTCVSTLMQITNGDQSFPDFTAGVDHENYNTYVMTLQSPYYDNLQFKLQLTYTHDGVPKTQDLTFTKTFSPPTVATYSVPSVQIIDDPAKAMQNNGNGQLESGEAVYLHPTLSNTSDADATEVRLWFTTTNTKVELQSEYEPCGDLQAHQSSSARTFALRLVDRSFSGDLYLDAHITSDQNQAGVVIPNAVHLVVGKAPYLTLSMRQYNFGVHGTTGSVHVPVTVTNAGSDTLQVTGVNCPAGVTISESVFTLSAGASKPLTATLSFAGLSGQITKAITFNSNSCTLDYSPPYNQLQISGFVSDVPVTFQVPNAYPDEFDVSGTRVVWSETRGSDSNIYMFDTATGVETTICDAPGDQRHPRISGTIVVWNDQRTAGDPDVYGYDLSTATEFAVAASGEREYLMGVDAGTVAFCRSFANLQTSSTGYEYAFNLLTWSAGQISPVTQYQVSGTSPVQTVSSGDLGTKGTLVWKETTFLWVPTRGCWDGGYSGVSKVRWNLSTDASLPDMVYGPSANDGKVALTQWISYSKDGITAPSDYGQVFVVDGTSAAQITPTDANDREDPELGQDVVVYRRSSGLYFATLSTRTETLLSLGNGIVDSRVDGHTVVWKDSMGRLCYAFMNQPELSITADDLLVDGGNPREAEQTQVKVTVHNISATQHPGSITVRLFDGDPDAGGRQVGADAVISAGIPAQGQATVTIPGIAFSTEGSRILCARCFTTAGEAKLNNTASVSITVQDSDVTGPAIGTVSASEYQGDGDGIIGSDEQILISFPVNDPSGVASASIQVDGAGPVYPVTVSGGIGTVTLPALSESMHTLAITATDGDDTPAVSSVTASIGVTTMEHLLVVWNGHAIAPGQSIDIGRFAVGSAGPSALIVIRNDGGQRLDVTGIPVGPGASLTSPVPGSVPADGSIRTFSIMPTTTTLGGFAGVPVRVQSSGGTLNFTVKGTIYQPPRPPMDITLTSASVAENFPVGTTVGTLAAVDPDTGNTFAYTLVTGTGSDDNTNFTISGDQLNTTAVFDYETKSTYKIRVRTMDQGGLSFEKAFTIKISDVPEITGTFGMVAGKARTLPITVDGDVVTFRLTGGGTGTVDAGGLIAMTGTTSKSVLSISVKKGTGGDGVYYLSGITSDGLLKSISASDVVLSGLVQINTLNQAPGKASVSLKLKQISDADIRVRGLPVSSIAVSGDVLDSRIVTTGSITKFSAATLLDSDILVGVATTFAGQFAGRGDVINTGAKLGSLKISGRKLPSGSQHPAYVTHSHISAPSVGTVTLLNVPADSGSLVHVLSDVGTLTVSQTKLCSVTTVASGTWKAGSHPVIWEVVD